MSRTLLLLFALTVSPGIWAQGPGTDSAEVQRANHYLDHVVVGIDDLDKGIEALQRMTGVTAKFDGRNARLGTQSAVIGLGEHAFLEIMAPDPKADPALIDPEVRPMILDRLQGFETPTPFFWAIGTSNFERSKALARRAGSYVSDMQAGTRKRGWGRSSDWTWAHVTRPQSYVMPLFVQWDQDTKPPRERAPEGCRLDQLKLHARLFKSVHTLLAAMQVDVEVAASDRESIDLILACPGGEVIIEGPVLTDQAD